MAKVKCEYCGHFINDTVDTCPKCGAVNNYHRRHADITPQTINELKNWYVARNLPPEHITRFFVGQNIKEPRAFGIYENNGEFVVYKNKSDGSRAIRYQGADEAYAVNEFYIRLKQEIINQKFANAQKNASNQNKTYRPTTNPQVTDEQYYTNPSYGHQKKIPSGLIILIAFLFFLPGLFWFSFIAIIASITAEDESYSSPSQHYYINNINDIYYCEGYDIDKHGYDWWKYNKDTDEWFLYDTFQNTTTFPDGITENSDYYSVHDIAEKTNIDYQKLNIYHSKSFIDDGNHLTPNTSYYYYDNNLYYFLDDDHGANYGTDNTGWYVYKNKKWEFFCEEKDKTKLGEDLWYYADDYSAGYNYNNLDIYIDDPSIYTSDFESTDWYKSYQSNEEAYQDYINEKNNDYDNDDNWDWGSDSDYDWDSGDSWDSGDTDWNSDW